VHSNQVTVILYKNKGSVAEAPPSRKRGQILLKRLIALLASKAMRDQCKEKGWKLMQNRADRVDFFKILLVVLLASDLHSSATNAAIALSAVSWN
jgi:hypothetical protein